MRRAVAAAILAAILLPACAVAERPEGIVERWLISLNQGPAGGPDRYAPGDVSERILPRWDELDPGELDVVEVGRGSPIDRGPGFEDLTSVPFRVVRLSGEEIGGFALVAPDQGGALRVRSINLEPPDPGTLPSGGGPSIGVATPWAWAVASLAAVLLAALSAAVMALAGKPSTRPPR